MHIHDELVIEADPRVSLAALCEQMGRVPSHGRMVWCSARTGTSAISIRKTDFRFSSKAVCLLQWEVEAGRFFYCLPEFLKGGYRFGLQEF
jgi:hypothetical protein